MADKRISQLVERVDIANNDVVPIVASGATTTNKATISSIQTFMQENLDVGVTSVGITIGTSGTDVNVTGSPVTTSGNITINIPTASATNRGLLSAADWTTFNNKQDAGSFVTLNTTQTITAQKTFTTSGSSDTMIISHGSGSGFALDVLKAGNNEALRVTKTSGSGNAVTISGGDFEAGAAKFGGTVRPTTNMIADLGSGSIRWSTLFGRNIDLTEEAIINGVNVGKGGGYITTNTRVGTAALGANTTGSSNTAIGFGSLQTNTTGTTNTAVGLYSLLANTTGNTNTAVGVSAMMANTTASGNSAFGFNSLSTNTEGSNNTAIGQNTLTSNTTGEVNTAVGFGALYNNTTGISNTAIGHFAGSAINSGGNNVTSSNSVYIGNDTRASASGNTNEIVIGSGGRGNGSNTVTIGNDSITNTYLKGAVTLTSASFTGAITSTGTGLNPSLRLTNTTASTGTDWHLYSLNNGNFGIYNNTAGAYALQLASTGAATFSNTTSGNALSLYTSYASGRQLNFGFSDGSVLPTAAFYIGNQTGVGVFIGDETTTNGLYVKAGAGNVGIGTDSPTKRLDVRASVAGEVVIISNDRNSAGDYGFVTSLGSNCNNTSAYHYIAATGGADRVYIFGNGNIQNTNNSYGALSDIKLKENITDASPKLEDLLKVKVRNYNLIGEDTKQIGVIAQELEEIFPAMIDESEDFEYVEVPQLDEEGNEVLNEEGEVVTIKERVSKGTTTKSVKYSVFVPMLIKAIQELKTEIDSLKNQIK